MAARSPIIRDEQEVDRLAECLGEVFDNDPEVMQLLFEMRSVVIALRGSNVETAPLIS